MRRAQITTRVTTWHGVTAARLGGCLIRHGQTVRRRRPCPHQRPNLRAAYRLARCRPPRADRRLGRVKLAVSCAHCGWRQVPRGSFISGRLPRGIRAELQASRLALAPVGGHRRRGWEPFRRTPSQLILPKSSRRDGGHMQRPLHAWPAHRASPGSSSSRPPERWLSARRSSGRVVNPIADEVSVVSCCPLVAGALICAVMQPPGKT
jgi:hypothetical protein